MCQKCVDLCRELGISDDEMGDFLWSATSFPFDSWPSMGETIKTMWERSGHDVHNAIRLAGEDMDREGEMYERQEREEARLKLCEGAD